MLSKQNNPRRIGIFGGTFNPIHLGHQNLMKNAMEELWLDELLLIPTYIPPHKVAKDLATGEDRMAMCRIAAGEDARITVSDIELQRGGSSYTYLTLRQLHRLYPNSHFFLIVGGDMLLSFDRWKRWRDILRMATLCAAPREEDEHDDLVRESGRYAVIGQGCIVMDAPVVEVSSTQIRLALKEGESASHLLHPGVEEYCREHRLYLEE